MGEGVLGFSDPAGIATGLLLFGFSAMDYLDALRVGSCGEYIKRTG